MIPCISIIGRPNVGKSTLFNMLISSNTVLSYNFYALTKDKHINLGKFTKYEHLIIDTPGIDISLYNDIYSIKCNINLAIDNSDIIFFVLDGKRGVFYEDEFIANYLRKINKYIFLIINKIDNNRFNINLMDFLKLNLGKPYFISASHDYNINNTINNILNLYCKNRRCLLKKILKKNIKISIIGFSGTGKSLFINSIVNENRIISYNKYFITRDTVSINLKFKNYIYTLIDTYSFNFKKFSLKKNLEKLSLIKTFRSIWTSNIIIIFFDPFKILSNNQFYLFNNLLENGIGFIIIINKLDLLSLNEKIYFKNFLKKKLKLLNFSYIYFISALKKININFVINSIYRVYKSSIINISTHKLNKIILYFNKFIIKKKKFKIKLNYAHQGGKNPPLIIINGVNLNKINNYLNKTLENLIRTNFNLKGSLLKINYFY